MYLAWVLVSSSLPFLGAGFADCGTDDRCDLDGFEFDLPNPTCFSTKSAGILFSNRIKNRRNRDKTMSFSSTFKKGANLLSVKSFVWQWQWELEFDDLIQPNTIFLKLNLFYFSKSTFDRVILPRNVMSIWKWNHIAETLFSQAACAPLHTHPYIAFES